MEWWGYDSVRGDCDQDEICVERQHMHAHNLGNIASLAYCVSHLSFVKIAQVAVSHKTAPTGGVTQAIQSEPSLQYFISATLTSLDSLSVINASTLEIHPLAVNEDAFFNTPVWYQLPGGDASYCEDCSAVSIALVPPKTQRVHVDVSLQATTETALLYLTSFAVDPSSGI